MSGSSAAGADGCGGGTLARAGAAAPCARAAAWAVPPARRSGGDRGRGRRRASQRRQRPARPARRLAAARAAGWRAGRHWIDACELGLALLALRHLAPGDHAQEKHRGREPQQSHQDDKSAARSDFKTHASCSHPFEFLSSFFPNFAQVCLPSPGLLHIRSGALTPSRSSPLAIPSISSRARNSRARLSSRCSLIIRFDGLL